MGQRRKHIVIESGGYCGLANSALMRHEGKAIAYRLAWFMPGLKSRGE
jgi:hypothetical protein